MDVEYADNEVQSHPLDDSILHETDGFISPYHSPQKEAYVENSDDPIGDNEKYNIHTMPQNGLHENQEQNHELSYKNATNTSTEESLIPVHDLNSSVEQHQVINQNHITYNHTAEDASELVPNENSINEELNNHIISAIPVNSTSPNIETSVDIKGFVDESQSNSTELLIGQNKKEVSETTEDSEQSEENVHNKSHGTAFAEMMASAQDQKAVDDLTHSERVTVSMQMEAEFQEMMLQEKQRKKHTMEGKSFSPTSEIEVTQKENHQSNIIKKPQQPVIKKSPRSIPSPRTLANNRKNLSQSAKSPRTQPLKAITPKSSTPVKQTARTPLTTRSYSARSNTTRSQQSTPTLSSRSSPARTPLKPVNLKLEAQLPKKTAYKPTPTVYRNRSATPKTPVRTPTDSPRSASSPRRHREKSFSSTSSLSGSHKKMSTKNIQSKIGSLDNMNHTPGGGKVRIESKRKDYSKVESKCGSRSNMTHTPGGGKVKIQNQKLDFSKVQSKCGSKDNITHKPKGGNNVIFHKKVEVSNVQAKIGSKDNLTHTPTGGKVKIEHRKVDVSNVTSKCGSKDNITHTPSGGNVKIQSRKVDLSKVTSKCGSKDNITHTPTGGKVKIFDKKRDYSKTAQSRIGSTQNITHTPGGGKVKIFNSKVDTTNVKSKIGSKDNITHTPGGGKVKIENRSLDFSNVGSKCGSLDNADHIAGGGDVRIFNQKPLFNETAKSKVGSLDNAGHIAGGGDVAIFDEKLKFKEHAAPRTHTGSVTSSISSS